MNIYNYFIICNIKICIFLLKLFNHQGGSLPGKIAYRLNKNILSFFKCKAKVIVITGTNGKTTTTNWIYNTFKKAHYNVASNNAGDNIINGVLTTIIRNSSISGKIKCDYLILEVDEHWVSTIFKDFKLDTLIILNLFRDQLDRAGEMNNISYKLEQFLIIYHGNLILNGDDPNVARIGIARKKNLYYFGLDQHESSTTTICGVGEGKYCPICNHELSYQFFQYSHIGSFACPHCHFQIEKYYMFGTHVSVKDRLFTVDNTTYQCSFEGIFNLYNAIAVISLATIYKLPTSIIQSSIKHFKLPNGRLEIFYINNCECHLNMAKNPTGLNVTIDLINEDIMEKDLLFVLNDHIVDGQDISWIWDADISNLKQVKRIICSGTRAYDVAIRFKYAEFNLKNIIVELNLDVAINELFKTEENKYIITNYTANQIMRKKLIALERRC